MKTVHILAIDDDPTIRHVITEYLGENDLRVTTLASGTDLPTVMARESVDLVLLDLRLPEGPDGLEIARSLREDSARLPIIMVSGRKEEADRVIGLELAADDYLIKPFSPRELLARIRAVLRRSRAPRPMADDPHNVRAYRFAGWQLNVRQRRLTSPAGAVVNLTNGEFNLLTAFIAAPQRVLSRDELLGLSRLRNDDVYERSIDTVVARLRRKLGAARDQVQLIATHRSVGYVFCADVEIVR